VLHDVVRIESEVVSQRVWNGGLEPVVVYFVVAAVLIVGVPLEVSTLEEGDPGDPCHCPGSGTRE
jgi:hypothetical protein